MKTTTIRRLLNNRIEKWTATLPDGLKQRVQADVIITGGCIASALLGEKVNDYDVYFRTKETAMAVAAHYVAQFNNTRPGEAAGIKYIPHVKGCVQKNIKGVDEERIMIYMKSAGIAAEGLTAYQYFESQPEKSQEEFIQSLDEEDTALENNLLDFEASEVDKDKDLIDQGLETAQLEVKGKPQYRPVFLSQNAITLTDKIQLVIRFFGEPAKLHENYDFVHCMCYFDYKSQYLHLPQEALQSLLTKTLVYHGSLYPIATIFRLRKFIARGWSISAGQLLKVIWQINEADFSDREVLNDQLIGVDQAYMHQLLNAIREDKSARVDATYIAALIDKIFD